MSAHEHVFLVAVTVTRDDTDRAAAELALHAALRPIIGDDVTEWWVAEDDRRDGSDNDSAVFVPKGAQHHGAVG